MSSLIDFYNNLYQSKQSSAMRPEQEYGRFLSYLKPLESGKNFLDIACGTGFLLKKASQNNLKTYGLDISTEAVNVAKHNSPDSEIVVAEAENLPFVDNFFKYITCLGSIEHFSDIHKGLQEMLRVGKTDAKYLLVVPNKNYFAWWFTKNKGTHQRDIKEELKTLSEWRKIFKDNGFKILSIHQDKYPSRCLPWFNSLNPLKLIKRILFKIIWIFLPLKYTYQFIFIAKKI